MGMVYYQLSKSSYQESLKILKADIQHANSLAAAIPRAKCGANLQMKSIQMEDQRCLDMEGRQQLESFMKLHDNLEDLEDDKEVCITKGSPAKKRVELDNRLRNIDFEREDECGICLEPCTKMVLPNCCHAMCIKCYRNWNIKSESCPFCRCSLKRVNSEDLCAYLQRRCGRQ